ncbi:MAG TPA: type II and III secretion system protein, partial [Azospira sp.]|nr:type II and III secretion system protein [Azospira sp.]
VIAHPETGTLGVRATSRQHEKVQEFLDRVLASARRQVMIEATLVEVQLSNNYQQGIDWSRVATGTGFGLALSGPVAAAPGLFTLSYRNDSFAGMVKLLDSFGTTRVLSSPKLSVLNNQTAVLKVVDNSVYFTIKADTAQNQTTTVTTYTTTLNQVPVGFVMNVTPQISDADTVLLNVRPSVSRIIGTVRDPNPALRKSAGNAFAEDIVSEIPVIRTREMESMLRVQNGNIAVMGGLMEDAVNNKDATLPGLGRLPLFGEAFTQRDDTATKTELVIFLRPTIIGDPSLAGDYAALREHLPRADFFAAPKGPQLPGEPPFPSGSGR